MSETLQTTPRVPVVCMDPSALVGALVFNPNSWTGASRGIVQSCWTEYAVLHHCVEQIADMCASSDRLCEKQIETLQQQWRSSRFDLQKIDVYCQVPNLHMHIEGFFAGLKTLLDLVAQLLSSEKVVATVVDSFHQVKGVYGGNVLNALNHNARGDRKADATKISKLILVHKTLWIDEAIRARDRLIHPEKGMHQIMFQLDLTPQGSTIVCERINPPMIREEPIDSYSRKVLKHAHSFCVDFLGLLQAASVPHSVTVTTK